MTQHGCRYYFPGEPQPLDTDDVPVTEDCRFQAHARHCIALPPAASVLHHLRSASSSAPAHDTSSPNKPAAGQVPAAGVTWGDRDNRGDRGDRNDRGDWGDCEPAGQGPGAAGQGLLGDHVPGQGSGAKVSGPDGADSEPPTLRFELWTAHPDQPEQCIAHGALAMPAIFSALDFDPCAFAPGGVSLSHPAHSHPSHPQNAAGPSQHGAATSSQHGTAGHSQHGAGNSQPGNLQHDATSRAQHGASPSFDPAHNAHPLHASDAVHAMPAVRASATGRASASGDAVTQRESLTCRRAYCLDLAPFPGVHDGLLLVSEAPPQLMVHVTYTMAAVYAAGGVGGARGQVRGVPALPMRPVLTL